MKAAKFLIIVFFVAGLAACENHMDITDVRKGTPSNADTVLPAKLHHEFTEKEIEAYQSTLPRVYWR